MTTPQDPWQNPNPQQPPAYPQGYPAYPGGGMMPPQPPRPPMPATVKNAVNLMFVGAALGLINIAIGFATLSSTKDKIRQTLQDKGTYTDAVYNSTVNVVIVGLVVGGLIGAGLWIWMAMVCKNGRNWGRIVSTVFFGIGALGLLVGLTQDTAPLDKIVGSLPALCGLIVIIMLWNSQSTPYFKPQMAYPYGYAPGQMPGQPPYGQQQPPYGQG